MMLLLKSFHIIAMVTWFSGLFYLPRLFVYHVENPGEIHHPIFTTMEYRLYYYITTPGAVATILFGLGLIYLSPQYYLSQGWMHAKLTLVLLLIIYHLFCGKFLRQFARQTNRHSSRFYRLFNEIPTLFLISIVLLVVMRP